MVWRKVRGGLVVIREAVAGNCGLLKADTEFERWDVPNPF